MVRRCTYPSIHFFVSRLRSVARRAHTQAFVCVCGVCDVCVCYVCVVLAISACSVVCVCVHMSVCLLIRLSLCSSFFSVLNDDDNDPLVQLALSVHTALTPQSARVRGLWPLPCKASMFASYTKQLFWQNCASLVPLGMKWACICAGNVSVGVYPARKAELTP